MRYVIGWIPVGTEARAAAAVFSLESLNVRFSSRHGEIVAVRSLSLTVAPGECLGVVGESGAGKSQAFLAALGLLAPNGREVTWYWCSKEK